MRRPAPPALLALLLATAAGCGAGPYGHSRIYTPLDEEEDALDGAEEYDPVMASRLPHLWRIKKVSAFGVVEQRNDRPGDQAELTLSVRRPEARNLCASAVESSCRTTVAARGHAALRAVIKITDASDAAGPISIGIGSLVRVVGDWIPSEAPGAPPLLSARYYRHWPRGYYVTTGASPHLRR